MSPHNDLHKNALHFLAKNKTAVDIDCTKLAVKFQDGHQHISTDCDLDGWMGWIYALKHIWYGDCRFYKKFGLSLQSTIS